MQPYTTKHSQLLLCYPFLRREELHPYATKPLRPLNPETNLYDLLSLARTLYLSLQSSVLRYE